MMRMRVAPGGGGGGRGGGSASSHGSSNSSGSSAEGGAAAAAPPVLSPASRRAVAGALFVLVAMSAAFIFLLSHGALEGAGAGGGRLPLQAAQQQQLLQEYPYAAGGDGRTVTYRKPKSNLDFGFAAAALFAGAAEARGGKQGGEQAEAAAAAGGDGDRVMVVEGQEDVGLAAEAGSSSSSSSSSSWEAQADDDDDDGNGAAAAVDAVDTGTIADWTPQGGDGAGMVVYMDFAQGRHTWGLAQHRALESVLTRYPEARVVVLQIAPGTYANYHYADALGVTHFQKYKKRGYNVDVHIVNDFSFLYNDGKEYDDVPAVKWWREEVYQVGRPQHERNFTACPLCSRMLNPASRAMRSATVSLRHVAFVRFAALWMTGGYYTDFSLLWVDGFPTERYFDMSPPACIPSNLSHEGEEDAAAAAADMPSSTTAAFRRRVWEIERGIALAVEKGVDVSGATAAAKGDDEEKVEEEHTRVYYSTHGASGMLGSAAMHFRERDPVLTCALLRLSRPKWGRCFEESGEHGRDCIQGIMATCIGHANKAAAAAAAAAGKKKKKGEEEEVRMGGVVQWFGCDGLAGDAPPQVAKGKEEEKKEEDAWRRDPRLAGRPAVWLGRHVRQGGPLIDTTDRWEPPPLNSLYHALTASPQVISLRKWDPALQDCPAEKWRARGACPSRAVDGRVPAMCAPSVFVPGTQKGASSFLFKAINYHPQVLRPNAGSQYKEPGLYMLHYNAENVGRWEDRADWVPFLEPGVDDPFVISEGTVTYMYKRESPLMIFHDNPPPPGAAATTTDEEENGSSNAEESSSSSQHQSPARLIFSLRDPVERAWSDFRFNYVGYYKKKGLTFRDVVESSLEALEECLEEQAAGKSARVIRRVHLDDADAALEEEVSVRRRGRGRRPSSPAGSRPAAEGDDGITPPAADAATGGGGGKFDWDELQTHYPYVLDCPQDPDVHHIVLRGLYAFSYEYFLRFFPREALHVVTQEELKEDQQAALARVVDFLGLCPYDFSGHNLEPIHVTGEKRDGDKKLELEPDIEQRLRRFYAPHNERLYELIGRDLGWKSGGGAMETEEVANERRR